MSELISQLRAAVGAPHVLTDGDLSAYEMDWRKRAQGKALAVVRPGSTEEVAAVVRACAAAGTSIVPQGGNTGMVVGSTPDASGRQVVLSLTRMNRVRAIDPGNLTITVDAGCVLQNVQEAAEAAGFLFPLSLAAEGSCTIGGNLGTNAGGTQVVRYGNTRELCLGLEVVTAQGEVWDGLSGLRKDNTGYRLHHLFVGAEGTLGIVTGAALRLHPLTPNSAHAWVAVQDPAAAVRLLGALQDRAGSVIQAFELVSGTQFAIVRRQVERIRMPFAEIPMWSVLIELGSEDAGMALDGILEDVVGAALEEGGVIDAAIASSQQQAADIWHVRHSVSEANRKEGVGITHDVAVRTSDVAAFIAGADAVAAARFPEAARLVVSHLGDGNIHYILLFTHGFWQALPDAEAFALEVEEAIHDVAAGLGGTFSAEHGIGRKLPSELERLGDPLRLHLMRRIKTLFDPQNLMNPGVLLAPPGG